MNQSRKCEILRLFTSGKWIDITWLTHQGKATESELDDLVKEELLLQQEKNPDDFMSDNRYMITNHGKEYVK